MILRPIAARHAGLRAVALVLALCGLLGGCAPRHDVVARVGNRTITVKELTDVAARAQGRYPGPPDTAKAMLLDDLVRRALLLEAAKARGLDRDSLTLLTRRRTENEVLQNAVVERIIPRDVGVGEGEVRRWYAWRDSESHAHLIYAVDRQRVAAARAELEAGAEFSATAEKYNLRGVLPPGGDLGWLQPGALVAPLDQHLREAPLGVVVGPFPAPGQGYFLMKISERRAHAQEPFAQARYPLGQMLTQRKQRLLSMRAFQRIHDAYHVEVDPEGPHLMFAHFNAPSMLGGGEPPTPTREELAQPLGRLDDERGRRQIFTFADGLDDLANGSGERPNPAMLPSLEQWIDSRLVARAVVIEAKRRHLAEEPAIAKQIDDRVDDYLLDSIYESQVVHAATPTDADLQAAYVHNSDLFKQTNAVTVKYLVLPDSNAAAELLARVSSEKSLGDAILLTSSGIPIRDETLRMPIKDPAWARHEGELRVLPAGAYGRPVEVKGGWAVFQVLSKDETLTPFEKLPIEQQQGLRSEAQGAAVERRLAQLTDSLRRVIPTQIDRARLKEIPWPERSPLAGLSRLPQ
jgi:hypothetical protein